MILRNKLRGLREIWQFDNRLQLLGSRLRRRSTGPDLYRLQGVEFWTDHEAGDANGARSVLTSPMYRRHLKDLPRDRQLHVVDLGANNGGFPLLLQICGYSVGRLVAVELHPETFNRLQRNLRHNFPRGLHLVNAAICSHAREIRLAPNSDCSTTNSIYGGGETTSPATLEEMKVDGLSLDQLFERTVGSATVDLCKIDIEGAEFEVFEGAECESIRRCRQLIIEIHHSPATPRQRVVRQLQARGFEEVSKPLHADDPGHHVHRFLNRSP